MSDKIKFYWLCSMDVCKVLHNPISVNKKHEGYTHEQLIVRRLAGAVQRLQCKPAGQGTDGAGRSLHGCAVGRGGGKSDR